MEHYCSVVYIKTRGKSRVSQRSLGLEFKKLMQWNCVLIRLRLQAFFGNKFTSILLVYRYFVQKFNKSPPFFLHKLQQAYKTCTTFYWYPELFSMYYALKKRRYESTNTNIARRCRRSKNDFCQLIPSTIGIRIGVYIWLW